jgi:hypothetical protein
MCQLSLHKSSGLTLPVEKSFTTDCTEDTKNKADFELEVAERAENSLSNKLCFLCFLLSNFLFVRSVVKK